jgi:hypothetical protein
VWDSLPAFVEVVVRCCGQTGLEQYEVPAVVPCDSSRLSDSGGPEFFHAAISSAGRFQVDAVGKVKTITHTTSKTLLEN